MTAYLWTIVVLLSVEIIGKALLIKDRNYERKPGFMCADIAVGVCLLVWTAYLLGSNP